MEGLDALLTEYFGHCPGVPDTEQGGLVLKNKSIHLCVGGNNYRLTQQACLENRAVPAQTVINPKHLENQVDRMFTFFSMMMKNDN